VVTDHGRTYYDRQVVLAHAPMLGQRLDAVQWLIPASPFPVGQDLILAKLGPLPNELQCTGLKTPGKDFAIHRYGCAPTCVVGMKVRYWMILFIPVHVDQITIP
jgi:hypothetical protein